MATMHRRRIRFLASMFLTTFFVGTMLSGHRHLNPIGDLISGERSDSGVLFLSLGRLHGGGEWLSSVLVVRDHPCPGCFWDDARTLAADSPSFAIVVSALPFRLRVACAVPGAPPEPRSIDRGPPPSV